MVALPPFYFAKSDTLYEFGNNDPPVIKDVGLYEELLEEVMGEVDN